MRIMQFMTSLTLRSTTCPELINIPAILAFGFDPTSGISDETVTYGITHVIPRHMFQSYLLELSPLVSAVPTSDLISRCRNDRNMHAYFFVQAATLQRELGHWKEEERVA